MNQDAAHIAVVKILKNTMTVQLSAMSVAQGGTGDAHISHYMNDIRTIVEQDSRITEFKRKVYLALLDVPRGATISYKELGERIGCRSPQAIGQALKRNPFAPDVPCHRVIASDGSIGGFHGQRDGEMIDKKRKLLLEETGDSL